MPTGARPAGRALTSRSAQWKRRVITSDGYEVERRRMRAKMDAPEGKKIYGRRKEWAEWPFGNLKHNLGFTEFYLSSTSESSF